VAAFGGGNEQIERMVTVFGQIRASGRLLGQDMLQLEQQGIPVIDILYEQLKKMGYQIKRTQLSRIGELGMPASIGIPALMRGMQERFGGMSAKQLQTMQGQLSNLHDSIQQVMGAITFGSFKAGKSFVRNLNRSFDQMTALMKKQKGKISLDQALVILGKSSPAMRDLVAVVRLTIAVLKPLGIILMQIVVPALVMLLWVIRQLSKPLLPILHLMQKFPKLMYIVSAALAFVTAAWALETLIIIWNNTVVEQSNRWGKRLGATQAGLGRILNILRWRFAKTGTAAGLYNAWMRKTAQSSNGAFRSYTRLEKGVRLLRIGVDKLIIRLKALKVQMWETMVENPVGAIIVGIILLLTFLIILYFKWKWFHNLVNRVAHYLWHHWLLMLTIINLLIPGLGLIIALVVILTKHWGGLFKVLGDIWNLFKRLFFWLADQVKTMGGMLIEYFRPLYYPVLYLIVGGFKEMVNWLRTAVKWAKTLVGWIAKIKGPASWVWGKVKGAAGAVAGAYNWGNQVLSPYPQAAAATNSGVVGTGAPSDPISKSVDRGRNAKGGHIQVTTNINVDGKKVAEATSRHRQDRSARR
jgi:tape measure domain-containing protein